MQWFKHQTNAASDPVIADAEDEFGDAGYSVYFKILEIYGTEFNSLEDGQTLNVSLTFLRRKLRKSWTKVEQILNFYQANGKLFFEKVEKRVHIRIPKFIEISSNWTKRTKAVPTEVPTEVPTAKEEKKKRIEKNKIELTIVQQERFDLFYAEYPKKQAKKKAVDSWRILDPGEQLTSKIVGAVKKFKATDSWRQNNGQFIPMPSTWLNQKRWEDEIDCAINGQTSKPPKQKSLEEMIS